MTQTFQIRDYLFSRACKHCWSVQDRSPLPKSMAKKLEEVGIEIPSSITTTGDFVDHFDPTGIYIPQ